MSLLAVLVMQLAVQVTPNAAALTRLRALMQSLEFEAAEKAATVLLTQPELTLEQRLAAYEAQGTSRAVMGEDEPAAQSFRMLLLARPDFELRSDISPKISKVFMRVQREERALAQASAEVARARRISEIKLNSALPTQAKGGQPLPWVLRFRDPQSSIEQVRVSFRREGQQSYSVLALESHDGEWRGRIGASETASPKPSALDYFIETSDAQGPLLRMGSTAAPLVVQLSSGEPAVHRPLPKPLFWSGVGVSAALSATAIGLKVALDVTQARYAQLSGGPGVLDGAAIAGAQHQGASLATGLTISLCSTIVMLVATAVVGLLTDFE